MHAGRDGSLLVCSQDSLTGPVSGSPAVGWCWVTLSGRESTLPEYVYVCLCVCICSRGGLKATSAFIS